MMPVITIPAPYGGINQTPGIGDPKFALDLREWIPRRGYLEMRHAFTSISTAVTPTGIFAWNGASGTSKIIITQSTKISSVTTGGTVADLKTGLTGGARFKWISTMFQDRLILTNGTDTGQAYDGTSIADLVTTGAAATTLWGCHTFKGRVYYWKENAQAFWYCAAGSFQGVLTEFPLNTVAARGGYLIAMTTLTQQGGEGADDLACFIMSTGEVIVYQGDDPSAARSWQLIGRFVVGIPLSHRSVAQVGSATFLLTTEGIVNLAKVLYDGIVTSDATPSVPIANMYQEAASHQATNAPAQAIYMASESLFIAHLPFHNPTTMFVMDINGPAWTTWTPCQNIYGGFFYRDISDCSAVVDNVLYIGGDSGLFKYNMTGVADANFASASPAYPYIVGFSKQDYVKLQNGRVGMFTTASPRTNYDNLQYLNCRVVGDMKGSAYDYSGLSGSRWWTPDPTTSPATLSANLLSGVSAPNFPVTTDTAAESFTFFLALSQQHATPIRWYETRLGWKMGGGR